MAARRLCARATDVSFRTGTVTTSDLGFVGDHPGLPDSPPGSEPLNLGHHHRDIRQLDLSSCLRGLLRHELTNTSQDRLLHFDDLGVDVSPEQCLLRMTRRRGPPRPPCPTSRPHLSSPPRCRADPNAPLPSSWTSPIPDGVRSSATDGLCGVRIVLPVESEHPKGPAQGPLEGEDIETEHWEDARHWMSIYDDLIRFKLGLLERVKRELPKLHPVAREAARRGCHLHRDPDGGVLRAP